MFRILIRKVSCTLCLSCSVAGISISTQALTPYQIMAKAAGRYQSLRTFQAVYHVQNEMDHFSAMSMNMIIKTIPSSGKLYIKTEISRDKTYKMRTSDIFTIDDGKHTTMCDPAANMYTIVPDNSNPSFTSILSLYGMEIRNHQLRMMNNVKMKLLAEDSVDSHAVYVIQLEAQVKPNDYPTKVKIYIDKNGYIIRKLTGSDMGFMSMKMSVTLISYKVNTPIPASNFHFALPKDARILHFPMVDEDIASPWFKPLGRNRIGNSPGAK